MVKHLSFIIVFQRLQFEERGLLSKALIVNSLMMTWR